VTADPPGPLTDDPAGTSGVADLPCHCAAPDHARLALSSGSQAVINQETLPRVLIPHDRFVLDHRNGGAEIR